ncbi:MAG: DUF1329 domain-containing protein [Deltaproteobacteria bacterium]|nr:DUF1329 domain-containing protein [Deltaproteobacteria bacterium]MBW2361286.1 DUF1329 domain-containing protein [Deltaproteobacteria bacterium]
MNATIVRHGLAVGCLLAPLSARAVEDAGGATPQFQEGDVITYDQVDTLRRFVPDEFWDNRDFFFYEGMQLTVGPTMRDYTPNEQYLDARERYADTATIGPDNSLVGYTSGRPFQNANIDCKNDPQAGVKIMWNFDKRPDGDGKASFFYSYWDRGEQLPLYYEGTASQIKLSQRYEPGYEETRGDIFRGEKRIDAFGVHVDAPFDARGIELLSYRYRTSDSTREESRNDDTWVYVPTLRRVRRISSAQRTDAVAGTDFTLDDLRSFNGIVPQYEWECLDDRRLISPSNTMVKAYPYVKDHNFGPYGLSYASDRWELRDAWLVRMNPKNDDHPYHHKDIWIDKQSLAPLYSFAYDRKEELWKILWHVKRWSEDTDLTGVWYEGWEGVPVPRALQVVSDMIVNVQTGTGNRIEFWDAHGTPPKSKGKIRRFIDVGRLTKGR